MNALIDELNAIEQERNEREANRVAECARMYPIIVRRANEPREGDAQKMLEILKTLSISPAQLIADLKAIIEMEKLRGQLTIRQAEADRINAEIRAAQEELAKVSQGATTPDGRVLRDMEGINRAKERIAAIESTLWGGEGLHIGTNNIYTTQTPYGPAWHITETNKKIGELRAKHARIFEGT